MSLDLELAATTAHREEAYRIRGRTVPLPLKAVGEEAALLLQETGRGLHLQGEGYIYSERVIHLLGDGSIYWARLTSIGRRSGLR